jgi:hypothetical protein
LVLTCVKSGRKKVDFAQAGAPLRFVRYSVVAVLLTVVFRLHSLPTCPLYTGQLCCYSFHSMGRQTCSICLLSQKSDLGLKVLDLLLCVRGYR